MLGQIIVISIVVGAIFGWLVGRFVEGYGFGLIANMVVGAIGSFIGVAMVLGVGLETPYNMGVLSFFGGAVGAVILLLIIGLFKRRE